MFMDWKTQHTKDIDSLVYIGLMQGGTNGKELAYQCRRHKRCGFDPWVGKIPWRRKRQPTPVSLPGESHGQRSLEGYSQSIGSQRVRNDWNNLACMHKKFSNVFCRYRQVYSKIYVEGHQSVQFSRSVVSNSLGLHGLQHSRPPCPSPTPGVYSNSCPLSRWCHQTVLSSVVPFISCLQSFPASGSFQMSQFFTSGGQSIGVSASTSVLPMNIQDWFPLG